MSLNLRHDCIFSHSDKRLDHQILFYPLKEKLYLPSFLIEVAATSVALNSLLLVRNSNQRIVSLSHH